MRALSRGPQDSLGYDQHGELMGLALAGVAGQNPGLRSETWGTRVVWLSLVFIVIGMLVPGRVQAQAEYAGIEPGSYIAVGVLGSGFNSGYGQQRLVGPAVYLDANLYRRVGFEAQARTLRFHAQQDLRQTTYLAGLRVSARGRDVRPYAKLLGGVGLMTYPYHDAHGRYVVLAPGAGLDWRVKRGLQVRLVDFEYQYWPQFTFGAMRSWGISSGFSLRVW